MSETPQPPATPLEDAGRGEVDALIASVYDELRALAISFLRGDTPSPTLQPTALVHEVYLRLLDQRRLTWQDRKHFFRIAARVMRRVLIDHWRAKRARKRSAEIRVELTDDMAVSAAFDIDFLALDDALRKLEGLDPQQAHIVELRFFAGLTVDETAEAIGVAPITVKRDWALARAFLNLELGGSV